MNALALAGGHGAHRGGQVALEQSRAHLLRRLQEATPSGEDNAIGAPVVHAAEHARTLKGLD